MNDAEPWWSFKSYCQVCGAFDFGSGFECRECYRRNGGAIAQFELYRVLAEDGFVPLHEIVELLMRKPDQ